jgi:hypothetical protein
MGVRGDRDALAHGLVRAGSCVAGEHHDRLSDPQTVRVAASPRSLLAEVNECGHLREDAGRAAHQGDRQTATRTLAETQVEIEERVEA